jgi:hypothetical protein
MIDPKIVQMRKDAAPKLSKILKDANQTILALNLLKSAAGALEGTRNDLFKSIDDSCGRLSEICKRSESRLKRFQAGLISVAVAGIEKSGKTTLLKTLTGIENLPTADDRCTAVCCEIIYSANHNHFDLEFYTDEQYTTCVIHPLIDHYNKKLQEESPSKALAFKISQRPLTFSEFQSLPLPDPDQLQTVKSEKVLRDLRKLQNEAQIIRQFLNSKPRLEQPLNQLEEWVAKQAEKSAQAKISTVSRCIIHTRFNGGSENLRLIDTPGVDDPSPLARERTLRTVADDADFLIVATMPVNKPSPTEAFDDFWSSISHMPDEINLMERMLFFLNWNSQDINKINIEKHKGYLINDNRIPASLFCGPLEAILTADVKRLMDKVNEHLSSNIVSQDQKVISIIENDLKSTFADIRRDVFDRARSLHPGDPDTADGEFALFLNWFSRPTEAGRGEGFLPELRQAFNDAVSSIPKGAKVQAAQVELDRINSSLSKEIITALPKAEDVRKFRETEAGTPPISHYMQTYLQGPYSRLVNTLSKHVRDFGPIMQGEILAVLKRAGLGNLISEDEPRTALQALYGKLVDRAPAACRDNSVLEAFKEITSLQESLQYVYRYEMRPALNFLNPLMWQGNKPQAVDGLATMLENNGCGEHAKTLRSYWEKTRLPGIQSPDEEHAKIFADMNAHALAGITSVLKNSRCRFDTIADDLIRDCQYRLTFGAMTEQAWRDLLSPHRPVILGPSITEIRRNSTRIAAFNAALGELGDILP